MGEILRTIRAAAVEVTAVAFYAVAEIASTIADTLTGEAEVEVNQAVGNSAELWLGSLRQDYHGPDTDQLGTCDYVDCYWCWRNATDADETVSADADDDGATE